MKQVSLRLIFIISITMLIGTAVAEERQFVSTDEWQPPVIDEALVVDEPWLLVLKIAQEEIGYEEGPYNDQSKYGEWFCGRRVAWCAELLTWCVNEADTRYGTSMLKTMFPYYGSSDEGAPWFMERGRFISDNAVIPVTREQQWLIGADDYMKEHEYIPYPGDYMWLFYYSRKQGTDHVAIVEGVSRDADGALQIHVIEGNNPDKVQRATYAQDYALIYGYGTPVRRACTCIGLNSTGDDAVQLQKDLETLGYYTAPGSGYMTQADKTVIAAVRKFQQDKGIGETGIFDLKTRAAMEKALEEANDASDGQDADEEKEASE